MHEQSLMNDLMAKILTIAKENGGKRVVAVDVWLGALSHMSAAHFAEHYHHSAMGTIAEGARLDTELSDDIDHPDANHILLRSVEVENE